MSSNLAIVLIAFAVVGVWGVVRVLEARIRAYAEAARREQFEQLSRLSAEATERLARILANRER